MDSVNSTHLKAFQYSTCEVHSVRLRFVPASKAPDTSPTSSCQSHLTRWDTARVFQSIKPRCLLPTAGRAVSHIQKGRLVPVGQDGHYTGV
eukprot:5206405-Amphidinium_carterae.1